jgi:hypothetical protein
MRIVVAGLAATYPLGGVFWDYLQYVQGLTDLGHEVLYLEDTSAWFYDPALGTRIESGDSAAKWLSNEIDRNLPGLSNAWFVRDARGVTYGADENWVQQFCRDAELFLNVSGASIRSRDDLPRAKLVYIDSDPMFSQCLVPEASAGTIRPNDRWKLDRMLANDATFSFGENIGQPGCLVPDDYFDWHPTRQPVLTETVSRHHVAIGSRIRKLTTIGSWDPYGAELVVAGRTYGGKQREILRFRDLPRRSPLPLEWAMAGKGPESEMTSLGWSFTDPAPISTGAAGYLDYLATSFAEWSVAKHAYVASYSGWFSGRSALYLALGVPAIVQDTGFSRVIPTGSGLLAFSTMDEAVNAIEQVASDYARHSAAAEEIAHTYFDSKHVLGNLLETAFASHPPTRRERCE